MVIGNRLNGATLAPDLWYKGSIALIRIYASALTATQVSEIYNEYKNVFVTQFNYTNFTSTTGLVLLGSATHVSPDIILTNSVNNQTANIWRTILAPYNQNFSLSFRMNIVTGGQADGFSVQWNTDNTLIGQTGGLCGVAATSIYAVRFGFYAPSSAYSISLFNNNTILQTISTSSFVGDYYYWIDYNYTTKGMSVFISSTSTKPASATHTFTPSVDFPSTLYYFGIGAATGSSNSTQLLKSLVLSY